MWVARSGAARMAWRASSDTPRSSRTDSFADAGISDALSNTRRRRRWSGWHEKQSRTMARRRWQARLTPCLLYTSAPGHQLQHEFFPVDNDRVSGVVATGVASHHRKSLREYIDNLALALVAPLGSDNDRSSASSRYAATQCKTPLGLWRDRKPKPAPGSHTRVAPLLLNKTGKPGKSAVLGVYALAYRIGLWRSKPEFSVCEIVNHQGHEVSRRLLAFRSSFVYLRAVGGSGFRGQPIVKLHRYVQRKVSDILQKDFSRPSSLKISVARAGVLRTQPGDA